MAISNIEWTDATWNPVTGCTRVSKGCDKCYAAALTRRLAAMGQDKYQGLINPSKAHFNGVIKEHPETLQIPVNERKPKMWFVNSMSDLFHKGVSEDFTFEVFDVMARTPHHIYQVLTKRPDRMRMIMPRIWNRLNTRYSADDSNSEKPLPNVWLGTSVEDMEAVGRIDDLANTPAAIRFLSCEPLLGPLNDIALSGIHWVIVGGESGLGARPMNIAWVEDLVSQCRESQVACFVKQFGSRPFFPAKTSKGQDRILTLQNAKGGDPDEWPKKFRIRQYPKGLIQKGL